MSIQQRLYGDTVLIQLLYQKTVAAYLSGEPSTAFSLRVAELWILGSWSNVKSQIC